MSWYELLLFAHVSMAVIWVGGALMMHLFGVRASMSGDPARMASLGEATAWRPRRLAPFQAGRDRA